MIILIVLAAAALMLLFERTSPGRSWPQVAGWFGRAALLNLAQIAVVLLAGVAWNGWMIRHRLWSADFLGTWGGGFLGYILITFVFYWWHRWRHEVYFFWRYFHQIHHSAQRLELLTSFYKHPAEILVDSIMFSATVYLGVGLNPKAASVSVLLAGIGELFYHWNVKTPYWTGFVFQRPESHCIHHERGIHNFNYSDLPLWDMLFGTFRNPRQWSADCGFDGDKEDRLGEMLVGVDVNQPTGNLR